LTGDILSRAGKWMRTGILISPLILLALASCISKDGTVEVEPTPQQIQEEQLEMFRAYVASGDGSAVRKAGKRFLNAYPDSDAAGAVRFETGKASLELGFLEEAAEILAPLASPEAEPGQAAEVNILLAGIDRDKGRFPEAAVRFMTAMALDPSVTGQAREGLSQLIPLLSPSQLADIQEAYPTAPGIELVWEGSLLIAEENGDTASVREIRSHIAALDTMETAIAPVPGRSVTPAVAKPRDTGAGKAAGSIGLICPLTGRFAPLGKEFLRGATVAISEAREYGVTGIELVVGDTRSNALDARETVLVLIEDEGVDAIVGGVLSSATIAAAQAAQHASTVLYSPVASEDGIAGIGDHIFQELQDYETEVAAIARVACLEMGLKRIAYMAEDSQRWRSMAELFRREVEGLGGILCVEDYYEQGSTDFKLNIERIRKGTPEALFIPSSTEDLVLILPQLSFYEFGVQLLGTSTWNSRNLFRMVGRDMEGAVFPSGNVSDSGEERYLAAAALTGNEGGDVNRFVTGGYEGVRKTMEAMAASSASGAPLRDEMERMLESRQHNFITLVTGEGIRFNIVRKERVEEYMTISAPAR
jgi:branched-chain amino acid transport system substrate-binding protein